jgi:DNA/RNA-binding domain of Phe-tRNA-synthetase-like protein
VVLPNAARERQSETVVRYFQHAKDIWADYPALRAGAIFATGITPHAPAERQLAKYHAIAEARLAGGSESELPEIQAWRRAFARMGLKPTQYRCAAEALLRRFRKEGALPRVHPLIDLCNAISLAYAIPVAVLDLARIAEWLEVRYASGDEHYLAFSGETEHPDPGEVTFVDADGRSHARRWTNRQSGYSAVRDTTHTVLIVAEALHDTAADDVAALIATVAGELGAVWSAVPQTQLLTEAQSRLQLPA